MDTNSKISIIVPVYKVEKYLDKCVKSIVNQTYKNLEIILVDDGSPDSCPKMCDEWAQKDERIKVIHKENGGLSSARNAGMDESSGEYIGFVDSDDWIEPCMFETLLGAIEKSNADIARCGIIIDYENSAQDSEYLSEKQDESVSNYDFLTDVVAGEHLAGVVWNKLYRVKSIGDIRFKTEDGSSEDILFNHRAAQCINTCVYNDVACYHYLRREGSITISEFGYGAFSIIRAKEYFLKEHSEDKNLYPVCIKSYIDSAFIVLSGVIRYQKCLDKYDSLVKGILKYKNNIFKGNEYTRLCKVKTLVLSISPKLYNKVITKISSSK